MHKPIKFLHTAFHRHDNLWSVPIMIGGFYNWSPAFASQGHVGKFFLHQSVEGQLSQFDIIFVGLSKPELDGLLLSRMRAELGPNSKTKIIVCIDYAVELWPVNLNPHLMIPELLCADVIFSSEPVMAQNIRSLVNNQVPVHHVFHPSDVEKIKKLRKPFELRNNHIIAMIHRYDNNWLQPWLVVKDIPITTVAVCLDGNVEGFMHQYFQAINPGMEFQQYLEWSSMQKLIVDSYHKVHTYGRSAVDAACLGIPNVGSIVTAAQPLLWPDLTTLPGDTIGQRILVERLLNDDKFYEETVEKASEQVEVFNYENRVKDLLQYIKLEE